jgi:hypothetical protein
MAWLESHQTLADHPKRKRLSRLLGATKAATIGHLHLMWWWAMDYAQDGDLTRYTDDDLADAGGWDGDPGLFVQSLIESGFITVERTVHDWDDYAGRLIGQRSANAARMREARAKKKPVGVMAERTCNERAAHVQGLHNMTQHDMTTTPLPPAGGEQQLPVGDPLAEKLIPANLFEGEYEVLEGVFLSKRISAFWQLQGEKRHQLTTWMEAPKDVRETAFRWALGESWVDSPWHVALQAIQYPNKFPTYPGSKILQMRQGKKPEPTANPYGDRPWAGLNEPKNFGYRWTDEADQVRYLIDRVLRARPAAGLYDELTKAYREGGFEAAMAAIWEHWPKKREAVNG